MRSTIREILAKIESLNNDLREEYERLSAKYGFLFDHKKVIFLEEFRKRNTVSYTHLSYRDIFTRFDTHYPEQ